MEITVLRMACLALSLCASAPAVAQIPPLKIEAGDLDLRLTAGAAIQVARVDDDTDAAAKTDHELELFARLDAEWMISSDIEIGAKVEVANTDRDTETLDTDEIYAFVSTALGRLEVGKQDGPADTLSYAAPVIALGQVRGDFSRYAGSQALLKPLDTRDSFKVLYLSPAISGFRAGISWAPRFAQNRTAIDPRSRTLVRDAVELALQVERPVGEWSLGLSGGYAFGQADAITTRADLDSWSIGIRARRGPLRIGGAYVRRGDSNRLERGFDQWELSGGIGWVKRRWGISGSSAITRSSDRSNLLFGLGGFYSLTPNIQLRSDLVRFREQRSGRSAEHGTVALLELQLKI